jgi:hypothetical protein
MTGLSYQQAVTGLTKAFTEMGPRETAAVKLLLWHESWLRREDFRRACLRADPAVLLDWRAAAYFVGDMPVSASSSQIAVLEFAIALAEDKFHLAGLGHAHQRAVAEAFATAFGQELTPAKLVHGHPDFIPCEPPCPLAVQP